LNGSKFQTNNKLLLQIGKSQRIKKKKKNEESFVIFKNILNFEMKFPKLFNKHVSRPPWSLDLSRVLRLQAGHP